MKSFLNDIRRPISMPLSRKIFYSTSLFILGVILGVISKALDEIPSNELPYFLEILDLRNFFSRLGVWIFLAVLIAVYSKSPFRASLDVFLFFAGMVSSYYIYTIYIAGFFPKSYMMIWIIMTMLSPLLAFICWYAKGKGNIAIIISSVIFTFMTRQTFAFGFFYFDLLYQLEFLLWTLTLFILYQSKEQMMKVITIGLVLYFLTAEIHLFWGI